jgi:hypothetical protein
MVCDGLFNKFDVEVRVSFCDNSTPTGKGKWRADFNQHSRSFIADSLKGKVSSFEFEDCSMDLNIPHDPGAPHIRCYTQRTADGENLVLNGANLLVNGTILTVQK